MQNRMTQFVAQAQLIKLVKEYYALQDLIKIAHQYGPKFLSELVFRLFGLGLQNIKPTYRKGVLTKAALSRARKVLDGTKP